MNCEPLQSTMTEHLLYFSAVVKCCHDARAFKSNGMQTQGCLFHVLLGQQFFTAFLRASFVLLKSDLVPCIRSKKRKISNLLKYRWNTSRWGHLGCFGIWEAQHSDSLTWLILSLSEIPLYGNKPLAGFNRHIYIGPKWTGVISNKKAGKCTL